MGSWRVTHNLATKLQQQSESPLCGKHVISPFLNNHLRVQVPIFPWKKMMIREANKFPRGCKAKEWHREFEFRISSVQFSRSVLSNSLQSHESQYARPPCPSPPTPRVYSNPCPLSRWCHPTISSSVIPFSSCPQSFLASGSFPMSQLSASGDQSIGVSASASVLPMNTQDWSPLEWDG